MIHYLHEFSEETANSIPLSSHNNGEDVANSVEDQLEAISIPQFQEVIANTYANDTGNELSNIDDGEDTSAGGENSLNTNTSENLDISDGNVDSDLDVGDNGSNGSSRAVVLGQVV